MVERKKKFLIKGWGTEEGGRREQIAQQTFRELNLRRIGGGGKNRRLEGVRKKRKRIKITAAKIDGRFRGQGEGW